MHFGCGLQMKMHVTGQRARETIVKGSEINTAGPIFRTPTVEKFWQNRGWRVVPHAPDDSIRSSFGTTPQPVVDDLDLAAIVSHDAFEKFQHDGLVTGVGYIAVEHLAFMVDSAPHIVGFAIDFHEHFVETPMPLGDFAKRLSAALLHLAGKERAEPRGGFQGLCRSSVARRQCRLRQELKATSIAMQFSQRVTCPSSKGRAAGQDRVNRPTSVA
jgi:hypothetical protein